ncbi:hypothetical protein [Rhizobium glycinendophyticum]|uniref:Uncharacterized protein n=1 Tax=Rhizobium glycinendophyticum TaxID=2589807 RepID=A0A504TRW3_9HYPH|nr:hypothetical protein [Rhizobium glycinendophyticum]TPP04247.1 hypothetical protein FJQ55_22595 [Rhizobium glycinendophyticum]
MFFVLRVEFPGQLTRQHILIHHCLELCFHQLSCLHGSEHGRNATMHRKRRRLTARCTGNDDFLYKLADDADQRLLSLGISVIAHHVKHGMYHRADRVFVDLVAQRREAFGVAYGLIRG